MGLSAGATLEHPVLDPFDGIVQTPAMTELEQQVMKWLWTGATGAVVAGPARVGKTTSLDQICGRVRARDGRSIPTFRMTMPRRDQNTVVSVFRQLCWSAELRISPRHTADMLAQQYLHFMADTMDAYGLRQCMLVVDECQRLSPQQFNVFAELYDRLRSIRRSVLTVFIGNDVERWHLIDSMETRQYAHIHGRFFLHRCHFQGLRSEKEVRHCLAQYDALRYPAESGPTYVEAFLPEAVKEGFRFALASTLMWRVFREHQKRLRLDSWGMQSFAVTVNTLLTDFLPYHGVDQLDEDMVEEALRLSGLLAAMVCDDS